MKHIKTIFLILVIPLIAYSNSFKNGFVDYDDTFLVIENNKIKDINLKNIYSIFSEPTSTDYLPLKELSFALDYHFWGLNPLGFHLTNIILFMINCLLVYLLILKISNNKNLSFLSSILFAIHPIHAEAVNWVASRKDVLSGVFFFLSILLYAISISNPSLTPFSKGRKYQTAQSSSVSFTTKRLYYFFSIISFILALFSKPSVITLPLLLPIYEYCFIYEKQSTRIKNTITRIIPFFIIAVISSLITFLVATEKEIVKTYWGDSFYFTFIAMLGVFFDYLKILLFPINLSIRYEFDFPPSYFKAIIGGIILIAFLFILFKYRKKNRILFFCISWFLITLIPVSNIIPIAILKADRYLYLPSFSFILFLSIVVYNLLRKRINDFNGFKLVEVNFPDLKIISPSRYLTFVFLTIFFLYFVLTLNRNVVWENSFSLWSDAVRKEPDSWYARHNLGAAYDSLSRFDEAITEYEASLRINPSHAETYNDLGMVYYNQGRVNEAIKEYKKALMIDTNLYEALVNLGSAYSTQGMLDEAIKEYKRALKINPEKGQAHNNLGAVYEKLGQFEEAIKEYQIALKLNPDLKAIYYNLGKAYYAIGQFNEAVNNYKYALRVNVNPLQVHFELGNVYFKLGNIEEAINEYKAVLKLQPDNEIAHFNLGIAYRDKGLTDDAIKELEIALKINPEFTQARQAIESISK